MLTNPAQEPNNLNAVIIDVSDGLGKYTIMFFHMFSCYVIFYLQILKYYREWSFIPFLRAKMGIICEERKSKEDERPDLPYVTRDNAG